MLDTCLHKLGHFFVGELHFAGKDFLLDAGREIICDVDASCIVAGTKNGGTADTVFLCDPVTGVRGSGFAVPTDSGKSTQWLLRGSQIGAA